MTPRRVRTAVRPIRTLAAVHHCEYCHLWLDELPIYIVRDPKRSVSEIWLKLKRFGAPGRKVRMLKRQATVVAP